MKISVNNLLCFILLVCCLVKGFANHLNTLGDNKFDAKIIHQNTVDELYYVLNTNNPAYQYNIHFPEYITLRLNENEEMYEGQYFTVSEVNVRDGNSENNGETPTPGVVTDADFNLQPTDSYNTEYAKSGKSYVVKLVSDYVPGDVTYPSIPKVNTNADDYADNMENLRNNPDFLLIPIAIIYSKNVDSAKTVFTHISIRNPDSTSPDASVVDSVKIVHSDIDKFASVSYSSFVVKDVETYPIDGDHPVDQNDRFLVKIDYNSEYSRYLCDYNQTFELSFSNQFILTYSLIYLKSNEGSKQLDFSPENAIYEFDEQTQTNRTVFRFHYDYIQYPDENNCGAGGLHYSSGIRGECRFIRSNLPYQIDESKFEKYPSLNNDTLSYSEINLIAKTAYSNVNMDFPIVISEFKNPNVTFPIFSGDLHYHEVVNLNSGKSPQIDFFEMTSSVTMLFHFQMKGVYLIDRPYLEIHGTYSKDKVHEFKGKTIKEGSCTLRPVYQDPHNNSGPWYPAITVEEPGLCIYTYGYNEEEISQIDVYYLEEYQNDIIHKYVNNLSLLTESSPLQRKSYADDKITSLSITKDKTIGEGITAKLGYYQHHLELGVYTYTLLLNNTSLNDLEVKQSTCPQFTLKSKRDVKDETFSYGNPFEIKKGVEYKYEMKVTELSTETSQEVCLFSLKQKNKVDPSQVLYLDFDSSNLKIKGGYYVGKKGSDGGGGKGDDSDNGNHSTTSFTIWILYLSVFILTYIAL